MKDHRTEILFFLFASAILLGAIAFFVYRMDSESEAGRVELCDILLPDPQGILSINKPADFIAMLKRQPELKSYFEELIPEDYFRLLSHVKYASVLLVYYPQAIMAYFPLNNAHDNLKGCFYPESPITIHEGGLSFDFYPRDTNRYFGCYEYKGVCVAGYSRKLLQATAGIHKNKPAAPSSVLKKHKDMFDKSALVNCLYPGNPDNEWQAFDLFIHEEQVCGLQYRPYELEPDSLIQASVDSLCLRIKELIPGLDIQPGYSKDDSAIYYTICAPLQPKN